MVKDELKSAQKKVGKENKSFFIASFPNLIDLVEDEGGELKFLIYDPTSKKPFVATDIEIEERKYVPPPRSSLPQNMVFVKEEKVLHEIHEISVIGYVEANSISKNDNLVTNGDVVDDIEMVSMYSISLYEEIVSYLKERAELPNEDLYDLLTLWIFHTYAMERADFSPIIYFLGLPEKGKSRMLKSLVNIARRGLRKISLTDAQILRDCTHLDATLALDMMSLWTKIEKAGSEDVFLNRPEKGITVSRVNRPERGAFQDTDYYTVFGPTIFATNELIHEILDTRAIPIVMRQAKKQFVIKVKPEDGLAIKTKLTAWRAATMGQDWPEVRRIANSRLGDITQPLYQIVKMVHPAREESFIKSIKEIEKRRIREKADSGNGQIIRSLLSCNQMVEGGHLKTVTISNEFNKDKSEKEKLSSRRILNRLKTMGFETAIVHGGNAAVFWNTELIDSLKVEFGISGDDIDGTFVTIPQRSISSPNVTESPMETFYVEQAEKE